MYMLFVILMLVLYIVVIYLLFLNIPRTKSGFTTFRSRTMQRIRPLQRRIEGLIYGRKTIK